MRHRHATSERNNKHMLPANIMLRVSITSGSPPPSERALPNNQYENRNQTKPNTKTMTALATPTRELAPLKSCQPYISRWTAGKLNNSMWLGRMMNAGRPQLTQTRTEFLAGYDRSKQPIRHSCFAHRDTQGDAKITIEPPVYMLIFLRSLNGSWNDQ